MRRRPYPKYKPSGLTWIGDIPAHWAVNKLKFISSVQFSNVDKLSIEDEESVRLCNYVDVYHNDFITAGLDFMEATATPSEIRKFTLQIGDVLVTKDSEAWNDIAIPAYVLENAEKVLCGYHLAQIRPDHKLADGRYLFRAFNSRGINDQFRVSATGVTRYGLGKYYLDNALFIVPPIDEQQAVADFLDRETARIDALIAKKQRQIELLQEKRAALISHAVTKGLNPDAKMKDSGIDWLGEVPEHWLLGKLGYVAFMLGGSTPSKDDESYWTGTIPWVSPKDMKRRVIDDSEDHISEKAIRETSLRLIQAPVVLIVVRGMILAHTFPVAITTAPITINQDMKALITKPGLNAYYFAFALDGISGLLLSHIEDSAHGTKCFRTDSWKNIALFMPEEVEQIAICSYLYGQIEKLEKLFNMIKDSIEILREYRSALIYATVKGKVDVQGEVP